MSSPIDTQKDREQKIVNALENYFSNANLLWDKVMLSKILTDPQGFISFESLCKLPKLRSLNATPEELRQFTLEHSLTRLKLSEDREKVARVKPYIVNQKEELDEWSIYVEGLARPYDNEQSITQLFNSLVGHVSFFRTPPNQGGHTNFFGYCFLEFDQKENVQKAVDLVNRYNRSADLLPGQALLTQDDASNNSSSKEHNTKVDKLALRVMPKVEWNRLKDEYVELLVDRKRKHTEAWEEYEKKKAAQEIEKVEETEGGKEEEDGYEKGVILHVDGLHPQSPKTTVKTLLETISGVAIAFTNPKKKGIPFVHIRMNNAEDAIKINEYFTNHYIVQETEKDVTGKEQSSKTFDCIKTRIIAGNEEKIYWENDAKSKRNK